MPNLSGPGRFTFDTVTNALIVELSGSGGGATSVNITQIGGSNVGMSNPLPVELSDGTNPFGTAGNPLSVNVLSGGGGVQPLFHDTTNSSTATLANGATFTGTAKSVTGYASALVLMFADQNGELHFQFSPDGTNWDSDIVYNYVTAASDIQPWFMPIGGPFYRIQFQNTSGVNQTVMRLNAYLAGDNRVHTMASEGELTSLPPNTGVQIGIIDDATGNLEPISVASPACVDLREVNGTTISPSNPLPVSSLSTSPTGAAVPADATYKGLNVGGNLVGATGVNPTGSVMAQQVDMTSAGGVAMQAAQTGSTDGTGANPVSRSIPRRFGRRVANTAPGTTASQSTYWPGQVTSPTSANWYDTNQTGCPYIEVTVNFTATQAGSLYIETADDANDTGNAPWGTNIQAAAVTTNTSSGLYVASITLLRRYWRIRWTNGVSTNSFSTFLLYSTESQQGPNNYLNPGTGAQVLDGNSVFDGFIPSVSAYGININRNNLILTGPLATVATLYNGTSGAFNYPRLLNAFKTVAATASGNTALWTPAAGKKFRLMRFKIHVTANAAQSVAGVLTFGFQDATTALTGFNQTIFIPGAAGTTMAGFWDSGWIDIQNGYLSAAANNVLNANLSAALTAGQASYMVAGTEE